MMASRTTTDFQHHYLLTYPLTKVLLGTPTLSINMLGDMKVDKERFPIIWSCLSECVSGQKFAREMGFVIYYSS